MRYEAGMTIGPRLALRIAREEAAAHMAALDLEQLFGEDAADADQSVQAILAGAQQKIVAELKRKIT